MNPRILVVDDDAPLVELVVDRLRADDFDAAGETDPRAALQRLGEAHFDVLLTDVEMPGLRGTDLLAAVRRDHPDVLIVVMTAFGSMDLAVQCLREGASDFLAKPFPHALLRRAIRRILSERSLRREVVRLRQARPADPLLVARSAAMEGAVVTCGRAARVDVPVLLTGESGTGKTMLARYIHRASDRAEHPFIAVNCAALPPQLVEAELFGARKGAFTGAYRDRPGLFAEAHQGTLLLDEIGDMPLALQPKLLQVIESGMVRPVGSDAAAAVDVRVLAATHVDLEEAVAEGRFRQDLYYRLDVVRVEVPSLRERGEDLPELVEGLLRRAADRFGREAPAVSDEAMRWLAAQHWPGNVRQLAHALERALVLFDGNLLTQDAFVAPTGPRSSDLSAHLEAIAAAGLTVRELTDAYIDVVLARVGHNKTAAARALGVDRRTLYRRADGGE